MLLVFVSKALVKKFCIMKMPDAPMLGGNSTTKGLPDQMSSPGLPPPEPSLLSADLKRRRVCRVGRGLSGIWGLSHLGLSHAVQPYEETTTYATLGLKCF